jgi:hypothetical protein
LPSLPAGDKERRRWLRASPCSVQSKVVGSEIVTEPTAYDAPKSISIQLFGLFSELLAYVAAERHTAKKVRRVTNKAKQRIIVTIDRVIKLPASPSIALSALFWFGRKGESITAPVGVIK